MRKPSTCWCMGSWRDKIANWGCLARAAKWLLYCKTCRHDQEPKKR